METKQVRPPVSSAFVSDIINWIEDLMNILDVVHRCDVPEPWAEGEKIPWDDPEFSRRMLHEHLSQDHDWASRKMVTIDRHVEWIRQQLPAGGSTRVLDLGCGPGLYASRLAAGGQECVGIDFSPASIEYARQVAQREHLACSYRQEDVRRADFGTGYGLVMFVYGELNVFRPEEASGILEKAHAALQPGGTLVLEVHTFEVVKEIGLGSPSWYSTAAGLFSARPHLCLQENFWDAARSAATERYYILDAETGEVIRYADSIQAYTQEEYLSLLKNAGFVDVKIFPSLTGEEDPTQAHLFVLLAHK
jgi:SAM-dependent methyltransferase